VTAHASSVFSERFPGLDADVELARIRLFRLADELPLVTPSVQVGRNVYRAATSDGRAVYPLIARDGSIVTVFTQDMLVHTPRGRVRISDLEAEE